MTNVVYEGGSQGAAHNSKSSKSPTPTQTLSIIHLHTGGGGGCAPVISRA